MTSEKLIEALETYSNVIVGFIVIQSVGFAFTFGTTPTFTCTVHTTEYLAPGLIVHFVASTLLACVAILLMARAIRRVAGEFSGILTNIYRAKIVIVILFALIPVVLISTYSFGDERTYPQCMADRQGA